MRILRNPREILWLLENSYETDREGLHCNNSLGKLRQENNVKAHKINHDSWHTSWFSYAPGAKFGWPLRPNSFPALEWGGFKGSNSLSVAVPNETLVVATAKQKINHLYSIHTSGMMADGVGGQRGAKMIHREFVKLFDDWTSPSIFVVFGWLVNVIDMLHSSPRRYKRNQKILHLRWWKTLKIPSRRQMSCDFTPICRLCLYKNIRLNLLQANF